MSELDAAISELKQVVETWKEYPRYGDAVDHAGLVRSCESAIRILEAAGKVERGAALEAVAHWRHAIASEIGDFDADEMKVYRQIRALLEAIPSDKGEPK